VSSLQFIVGIKGIPIDTPPLPPSSTPATSKGVSFEDAEKAIRGKSDFNMLRRYLRAHGPNDETYFEGALGWPLLTIAAQEGNINAIEMLLEFGADINARDNSGQTALISAADSGKTNSVDILIRQPGIDIDAQDNDGDTALGRARNREIVKLLEESGADCRCVSEFCRSERFISKCGVPLVAGSFTAALAAVKGQADIYYLRSYLQNHGPDDETEKGFSLLMIAGRYNEDTEALEMLLDAGANVNYQTGYGYSALTQTAAFGEAESVKILLQQPGINVNLRQFAGETALYDAADFGQTETVKYLLQHPDIDLNLTDEYGNTALGVAYNEEIVRLLKQRGAECICGDYCRENILKYSDRVYKYC